MNKVQQMFVAWKNGIKRPYTVMQVCDKVGLPFYVACAMLEIESSGGDNIFGHDPTIFVGAGRVTKEKYLRYKAERKRTGKMQGVGPCQLTWFEYQDMADAKGGCWVPRYNMEVGFKLLNDYRRQTGSWAGAGTKYNGSSKYGQELLFKAEAWRRRLT
jgi:hypothetical protein